MKRFNWMFTPGVVMSLFFLWLGITNIQKDPLFYTVWLIICSFTFYRTLRMFLGMPITNEQQRQNESSSSSVRLKELEDLYNQGLITREELEEKRQEILDEI